VRTTRTYDDEGARECLGRTAEADEKRQKAAGYKGEEISRKQN
jgi:hypothetical protein